MATVSDDDLKRIEQLVLAGQKIEAIKWYREAVVGAGLADAKQAVEEIETRLRATQSEKFAEKATQRKKGCTTVLALLMVLGMLAFYALKAFRKI